MSKDLVQREYAFKLARDIIVNQSNLTMSLNRDGNNHSLFFKTMQIQWMANKGIIVQQTDYIKYVESSIKFI